MAGRRAVDHEAGDDQDQGDAAPSEGGQPQSRIDEDLHEAPAGQQEGEIDQRRRDDDAGMVLAAAHGALTSSA